MSLALLLLLLLAAGSRSRLVNVTIDDQHGDAVTGVKPVYSPGRSWHAISESSAGLLDMAQVHDRTLQSLQRNGSITLAFEGVAIYVFFVLPQPATALNVTSFLDEMSRPAGQYNPAPGGAMGGGPANRFAYNQIVFSSGPLPQRTHSLTMEVHSYLTYFDYAVYTVDDGDPPESRPSGPAPTTDATADDPKTHRKTPGSTRASLDLGALVGGLVAAAAVGIVLTLYIRRRTRCRGGPARVAQVILSSDEVEESREAPLQAGIDTLVIGDSVSPFFTAEFMRAQADSNLKQDAWQTASEKAAASEGTRTHEPGPGDSMSPLASSEAATLPSLTSRHWTRSTLWDSGVDVAASNPRLPERAIYIIAEMERMRTEIDMLRRVARAVGPPPYSDGGWSERSAHAL